MYTIIHMNMHGFTHLCKHVRMCAPPLPTYQKIPKLLEFTF